MTGDWRTEKSHRFRHPRPLTPMPLLDSWLLRWTPAIPPRHLLAETWRLERWPRSVGLKRNYLPPMCIRQSRFRQPCPNLTAIPPSTTYGTRESCRPQSQYLILAVCVCQEISRARGLTPEFRFFFQTAQPGCGEGSSTHSSPTSPVVRAQQVNRPEV